MEPPFDTEQTVISISVGSSYSIQKTLSPTQASIIMSLSTILLIVVVFFLISAIPTWPYSKTWGYMPSSGIGVVLLVLVALLLLGKI